MKVFLATVQTIERSFAWEQGVNDMYSEEGTHITEILGKRLVVVVNPKLKMGTMEAGELEEITKFASPSED